MLNNKNMRDVVFYELKMNLEDKLGSAPAGGERDAAVALGFTGQHGKLSA